MNIQELHEKKKAFEMKLFEIIGKELSEFANEGVTITSIDVDFENVWPANNISPIKVLRQVKVCTSIWKIVNENRFQISDFSGGIWKDFVEISGIFPKFLENS